MDYTRRRRKKQPGRSVNRDCRIIHGTSFSSVIEPLMLSSCFDKLSNSPLFNSEVFASDLTEVFSVKQNVESE